MRLLNRMATRIASFVAMNIILSIAFIKKKNERGKGKGSLKN